MPTRTTLATVARHAGVSTGTASKVLNGRAGVGEETRQRVQAAVVELGYHPTTARADDVATRVRRVSAIFTSVEEAMYVPQMLNALLASAPAHQIEIIPRLVDQPASDKEINAWARSLLRGGCQGIISVAAMMSPDQVEQSCRLGLAFVMIDGFTFPDVQNVVSVGSNNFEGGFLAGQHLLELSHRSIGIIHGPHTAGFARERSYGFQAALSEAGVEIPAELSIQAPFEYEGGLEAGQRMLARPDRPTAIFANSDGCAIGVMEAARRLGVRVPADLSVIGFDDSKLAVWSTPQLTTIRQPITNIARVALRTISRLLEGRSPDSHHIQLATRLVVRGSTAAPPRERQRDKDHVRGDHASMYCSTRASH